MTDMAELEEKLAKKGILYIATLCDGRQFWIDFRSLMKCPDDWIVCQEITVKKREDIPPAIVKKSEIVSFTYLYEGREIHDEDADDLEDLFKLFAQGVEDYDLLRRD